MGKLLLEVKRYVLLWLAGFKEACCFHRAIFFCASSKMLLIRTGQCFLLNGLIFLGSLFILRSFVIPILMWILPDQCDQISAVALYSFLRSFLIQIFYVLWFYPLYLFSLILGFLWYSDIAKYSFEVIKEREKSKAQPSDNSKNNDTERPGVDGLAIGIGEQIYSGLLLTIFFFEVSVADSLPFIGKATSLFLLSWMNAYYCFESKWNYSGVSLNSKLEFFESNWAFFAGFGSPSVIPGLFFTRLISNGIIGFLYPVFVLTAAGTREEDVINSISRLSDGVQGRKIPIFYFSQRISTMVLHIFPKVEKEN
ncbi:protein EI24 isoform X1 [Carex littledalei]|uniref:Protein EI24 isoform X1 n=1 Tax=Carex littledalei TaxID=544730 RepID=A0A833QXS9_9POAL|nr:protein EI24 isoform X1 [Carex littledalei]